MHSPQTELEVLGGETGDADKIELAVAAEAEQLPLCPFDVTPAAICIGFIQPSAPASAWTKLTTGWSRRNW